MSFEMTQLEKDNQFRQFEVLYRKHPAILKLSLYKTKDMLDSVISGIHLSHKLKFKSIVLSKTKSKYKQ